MEPLSDDQLDALPKEAVIVLYKAVFGQLAVLQKQNDDIRKKMDNLQEQVSVLLQRQFGRKSEKTQTDGQLSFDLDNNAVVLNEAEQLADSGIPEELSEAEVITYTRKKAAGKREADLRGLETIEEPATELPEEKLRELFPNGYKRLPDQVYPKLEFIPARFAVHYYHIAVYADKRNEGIIVRADHPNELLPKSLLSESLAAGVINEKYINAVPLARYSSELGRSYGVRISRQTMAGWIIELHKRYLYKIYDRMRIWIIRGRLIHCDETPFKLIHSPGQTPGSNHKSYMRVYHTHEDYGSPPIYLYCYCDGRSSDYPREFLKDFNGILVTDGYQVYHSLAKSREGLTVAGCWVHAKRKFSILCRAEGAEKSKGTVAEEAVRRIAAIFHAEHQCRAKSPDDKLAYRNKTVRPLVDSYFAWLKMVQPGYDKGSQTGIAITYSLNQEPFLRAFLNNPIIPLSNNDAERSIRKFVVGRKNWVIIDSVNGANASACLYSIAETAKANGLRPYNYFKYVLETMTAHIGDNDESYIDDLLPWSDKLPDECRIINISKASS